MVSSLGELGDGHGFRKVRAALGVTAFGVNAIVFPPRYEGPNHFHDLQDELYFVHRGTATFTSSCRVSSCSGRNSSGAAIAIPAFATTASSVSIAASACVVATTSVMSNTTSRVPSGASPAVRTDA